MARDKNNLIAGACLAVFGAYVITGASRVSYTSEVGPGPGFFPLWVGIGMVIFAAALMMFSFLPAKKQLAAASWRSALRALIGWLAVMVAVFLFGRIGFSLSFILLTAFLICALDRRPIWLAVTVGVVLAVSFHLLFVLALDVSLPAGPWGF